MSNIKEDLLKSALWYHSQGLAVLPVAWNGKNALVKWKNVKKFDKDFIQTQWSGNGLKNIAIMTGDRSTKIIGGVPYKLLVIDIDNKDGHNGNKSIEEWQEKHGRFPSTWTETTPSNGVHYYFLIESSEKVNTTSDILDGIDTRGDGGYIVATPSQLNINGTQTPYKWVNSPTKCEIAIANQSVRELVKLANNDNKKEKKPQNEGKKKEKANQDEKKKVISKGGRVQFLVQVIAQQDFGTNLLDVDDIKTLIRTLNQTRVNPPLTDEELEREVFPAIERFDKYTQNKTVYEKSMLVSLDEIEEQDIEWLVPGWIPKGTITIMGGDGGVGKTTLWCSLVANLTAGEPTILEDPLKFEGREPVNVLYFSSEDDTSRVIKQRLESNKANMKHVKTMLMSNEAFTDLTFSSDLLEQMIQVEKPALCVFDPLQSFLGEEVDMNKRNHMRKQLNHLMQLGERYGTAFLVAMHTNKRANVSGRSRFAESTDIYDISRSAILVGNTKSKATKYIDNAKNNYAPLQDTILFSIEDGKPLFGGTTNKKDYDFIHEKMSNGNGSPQLEEAKEYIIHTLRTCGQTSWKELKEDAKELNDFSKSTMDRAKKELIESKEIKQVRKSLGNKKGITLLVELNYKNNESMSSK